VKEGLCKRGKGSSVIYHSKIALRQTGQKITKEGKGRVTKVEQKEGKRLRRKVKERFRERNIFQ